MGLFDGLKDAQVFEGGNYLGLGIYDLEVIRCLVKPSRASGMVFIAELRVLSSTNQAQPPGVTVGFVQKMQDQAIAFAAIKEFVVALMGFDMKEDKERIVRELDPQIGALTDAAIGPQNIFAGRRIHAETYEKETKTRKIKIVLPRWSPYAGEQASARSSNIFGTPAAPAPAHLPPPPAPAAYQPPPQGIVQPAPSRLPAYPPQGPSMPTYPGGPPPAWNAPPPEVYIPPDYRQPPPASPAPPPGAAPTWNPATQRYEMPR